MEEHAGSAIAWETHWGSKSGRELGRIPLRRALGGAAAVATATAAVATWALLVTVTMVRVDVAIVAAAGPARREDVILRGAVDVVVDGECGLTIPTLSLTVVHRVADGACQGPAVLGHMPFGLVGVVRVEAFPASPLGGVPHDDQLERVTGA